MLVLSRKKREEILIGPDIVVTVIEIKPGQVRIGITAPLGVPVDRREIRKAKHAETLNQERKGP